MRVETRLFGTIEIAEDKIITLGRGLIGYPNMKRFTLIFDEEKQDKGNIMWLQSLDEPQFAMPVVDPSGLCEDYNPTVNDELLLPLGEFTEGSLFVLVTIKVPSDITKMTINLKGPIIINTDNLKGEQIIVEDDVQMRFPIYDILKSRKEKAGE